MGCSRQPVWLFDLDNTLHYASAPIFTRLNQAMTDYMVTHLQLPEGQANELRRHYWQRYGATVLGLERHHGIRPQDFLQATHILPNMESQLRMSSHDRHSLRRLPGRKIILTNAPAAYTARVLKTLKLEHFFESIVSIESMRIFGHLRPKPDKRMFKVMLARLRLVPSRTRLVEDTLDHLRAARSLGLTTIWMRGYINPQPFRLKLARSHCVAALAPKPNSHGRRVFVDSQVHILKALRKM